MARRIPREKPAITVRTMTEVDLPAAKRVFQLAFGTFLGAPDPESFRQDQDLVATRWRRDPSAGFVAEINGALAGSCFACHWGGFGYFGPLTIHPDFWDQGVAQALLKPVLAALDTWGCRQTGLFTFATSPKHLELYRKFGFWPQHLTAVLSKPVTPDASGEKPATFGTLPASEKRDCLADCRSITDSIYPGLDLSGEILAVDIQHLGDTVLVRDANGPAAFAVCHCGRGSEAGDGKCYVKFAAARNDDAAERNFAKLLRACTAYAAAEGMTRIEAGTNLARRESYAMLIDHGFRTDIQGVAMQRSTDPGFNRAGVFVVDDWR